MRAVGSSATAVARQLRKDYAGLDYMDAALITEYAQAEGEHEVPGTGGLVLVYREGTWYLGRKEDA